MDPVDPFAAATSSPVDAAGHGVQVAGHSVRLPLPVVPPPIRSVRFAQGAPPPPPPSGGAAPTQVYRSPQASANPAQLLGPGAVVRSAPKTTRNVIIGVVLLAFLGLGVVGLVIGRALQNTTLVTSLEPGDCLSDFFTQGADGEYVEVFFVDTAPCEELHALEVYAVTDLLWSEQMYPGVDAAFDTGQSWCFSRYDAFIGGDYDTSLYDVWTFVPQEESWNAGDRTVQCMVGHYDEVTLVTDSLEGIDR